MMQFTKIVKHLLIINVLFFLGSRSLLGEPTPLGDLGFLKLALFYPQSELFQPFQLVTHMFMHGDFNHLLFNMLSLFFLGPMVEMVWRDKKFLFYYLACGFGAMFFHMIEWFTELQSANTYEVSRILGGPVLGASGAVYGVLTAFAFMYPDRKLMLLFPPIPIKAKYLVGGLIAIDLYLGFSGQRTGIAHFAHVGGAATGLAIMYFWRQKGLLYGDRMR